MDKVPRYIGAHRLSPDEFWEDVARVLSSSGKIEGKPIKVEVLPVAGHGGIRLVIRVGEIPIGVVWAERHQPTWTMPADFLHDIVAARVHIKAKYAYVITTGRVTMGARHVAKQHNIQIIDGPRYEQMRAKAYRWDKPVVEPIFFDRNDVKSVEKRREATPEEMRQIYEQLDKARGRLAPEQPKTSQHQAVTIIASTPDPIPEPVPTPKPKLEAAKERSSEPIPRKKQRHGRLYELTALEEAVILAWRTGNKVGAVKMILNE